MTPPLSRQLTGALTGTVTDPTSRVVYAVAFGSGGTTLATCDWTGRIYLWDATTSKITATFTVAATQDTKRWRQAGRHHPGRRR